MNAKDLLEIFNGINDRQREDHDRIETLAGQLREALVVMMDIACDLMVLFERQKDEHDELSKWHARQTYAAERAENGIDSHRAAIGRLMAEMDNYNPEER